MLLIRLTEDRLEIAGRMKNSHNLNIVVDHSIVDQMIAEAIDSPDPQPFEEIGPSTVE